MSGGSYQNSFGIQSLPLPFDFFRFRIPYRARTAVRQSTPGYGARGMAGLDGLPALLKKYKLS